MASILGFPHLRNALTKGEGEPRRYFGGSPDRTAEFSLSVFGLGTNSRSRKLVLSLSFPVCWRSSRMPESEMEKEPNNGNVESRYLRSQTRLARGG